MRHRLSRTAAAALVGLAASASADPDMLITVDNYSGDRWRMSAEYSNPFSLIQVWADTQFDLTGDGSLISITDYNPSYDTTLGDATVTNGSTASFRGFANAFFGTPDDSNPLWVVDFRYAGDRSSLGFEMVGQNSAAFDLPPFGQVYLYHDADGNPGPYTWDVVYIPAPATLALAPIALVAARRRRG